MTGPGPDLLPELCLRRQTALLDRVALRGIDAVLILDRRHVHYLSGFWARSVFAPAMLLRRDERPLIALPYEQKLQTADTIVYDGIRHGTLIEDSSAAAVVSLLKYFRDAENLGSDQPIAACDSVSVAGDFLSLRRKKWSDEMTLLRHAIGAVEAGYAYAAKTIAPGLDEIEFYAGLLQSITTAAGEPIGELGNDFQSGSEGGPPRNRRMADGELFILDLGASVRSYHADLCRTFAVGGRPSSWQLSAQTHVLSVLNEIESSCKLGVSCRKLYEIAEERLNEFGRATFGHHLGHGTGLSPHEAPRLNPHWDDTLQVGDVFTIEPGLYHPDLRAGVRVEQMYHVTETGVERLSHFPTELNHA